MKKLLLSIVAVVLALAAPATATERSLPDITRLARSAADGDARALEALRSTTAVDGSRVDVAAALAGADPDETTARLRTLIRVLETRNGSPIAGDRLGETLADVLSQPKFQAPPESLWDRLVAWLSSWFLSLLGDVIALLGGPLIAGILALGLLAVIVALSTARIARRRAARIDARLDLERLIDEAADPADLERMAREAADRGDFGTAVRARFVAGILRLHTAGRIRYTKGLTTGQIADQLQSDTFSTLASTFDEIAYGDRPGTREDHAQAVESWSRLLAKERV